MAETNLSAPHPIQGMRRFFVFPVSHTPPMPEHFLRNSCRCFSTELHPPSLLVTCLIGQQSANQPWHLMQPIMAFGATNRGTWYDQPWYLIQPTLTVDDSKHAA